MNIDIFDLPETERGSQEEGQGSVTSTWNFTVSPDIAKWNYSNVSCLALPSNDSQMKYDSDPELLLIQGNPV